MKEVKLVAFDIDGVLTDGRLYYGQDGEESGLKVFNAQDGLGITLLRNAGFKVAVISGRSTASSRRRMEDLKVDFIVLGETDKAAALRKIHQQMHIGFEHTVYMGDDLIDIAAMQLAAIAYAPQNAVKQVKRHADYVCARSGGEGAVREAIEHLLAGLGIDPITLVSKKVVQ